MMNFTKMHGAGNDFVFIENFDGRLQLEGHEVAALCDRHRGVGADGLVLIASASDTYAMVYLNADGSPAGMCGNALRCTAHYLYTRGHIPSTTRLQVGDRLLSVERLDPVDGIDSYRVDMGPPQLVADQIGIKTQEDLTSVAFRQLPYGPFVAVGLGNPHAVFFTGDPAAIDIAGESALVRESGMYPEGVNVEFAQVVSRDRVTVRVDERGVGETMACGSGACAVVVAGMQRGLLDSPANVSLPGGTLRVTWDGNETSSVWLTGPAQEVFASSVDLAELVKARR